MKKIYLFAVTAILIASCSDETTVYNDATENISTEGSQVVLAKSILYDDAGVLKISNEDQLSGKAAKIEEQAGDYPMTLIARVDAPSFTGGENLGASHVDVDGDYAYVSYNTVGLDYAGAIDIVNVSDPANPLLTSRMYYRNADVNAIAYSDGYVYAVGGVDAETSTRATANSFLIKIPVAAGQLNVSAGLLFGFQEGFNATDVKVNDTYVFVGSGNDGYLTSYKKSDLSVQTEATYGDLRSIAFDNGNLTILDGSSGVIFLDANFNVTQNFSINSDLDAFSKRTLAVSDSEVFVSEGSKGAGVYEKSTGTLKKYLPILINPDGVQEGDIVTNAVAVNEDIVLMANGGAGLSLSETEDDGTELVGVINLNGSVNYVASKGDYIFAASGTSGLQIVLLNRPDEGLSARCADLAEYEGNAYLYTNNGETVGYSGAKSLNQLGVGGSLLLCGSWTVASTSYVYYGGILEIKGDLTIGRNNDRKDIVVNDGGKLVIDGDLTVYGDLKLENTATVEFIGDSSINIFGDVVQSAESEISGEVDDLQNKL